MPSPAAGNSTCVNPLPRPPHAARILVIRLGAIGDCARTIPAARRVRAAFPQAQLHWLVEAPAAPLLRAQPWLNAVHVFPRAELRAALQRGRLLRAAKLARNFSRNLAARQYDLVLDFHSILKSGALSALTRAPMRVSYARPFAREGARFFATHHAQLRPHRQSRFARNAALADYLGIAKAENESAPITLPAEAQAAARAAITEAGARPIMIHPGSSPGAAYKRWNAEGYAEVAIRLAANGGPRAWVFAGRQADEINFASQIVALAKGAAQLAPPANSLVELAALLAHARVFIGSDSGPLHIAALTGAPVVQLIGPTHPIENAPWPGAPRRQVRVQIECNPCRRGCAAANCMRAITPRMVTAAARELLAQSGARAAC